MLPEKNLKNEYIFPKLLEIADQKNRKHWKIISCVKETRQTETKPHETDPKPTPNRPQKEPKPIPKRPHTDPKPIPHRPQTNKQCNTKTHKN